MSEKSTAIELIEVLADGAGAMAASIWAPNDPIAAGMITSGATGTGKVIARLVTAIFSPKRIQEYEEAQSQRVQSEFVEQMKALESRLAATQQAVRALEYARLHVEEIVIIVQQLHEQAKRAVTDERMKMICAAMAGSFDPDLEIEMKSRAARAVVQLEASDLVLLRALVRERFSGGIDNKMVMVEIPAPNAEALLSSGVLSAPAGTIGDEEIMNTSYKQDKEGRSLWKGTIELTSLGLAVLRLVETSKPTEPAK